MLHKIKDIIYRNKIIVSNFSYLALLEIFILIAPLITYPYLVKVLGKELYGWVITGQITATYASIFIDFGFRRVSAKYVAETRENILALSRVVSTVVTLRLLLWFIALFFYIGIILAIPSYRGHWILFVFSYGITFASVLFPDFYFQGIERMRSITWINIFSRSLFLISTFIFIKEPSEYVFVPALWSVGYLLGGIFSLYIIFHKHGVHYITPRYKDFKFHLRETTPIFLSDVMLNVKDKFNYNLMGGILGMADVVIYDLGTKIVSLLSKPTMIFSTVIFPKMSRKPNVQTTKHIMFALLILSILLVTIIYFFLPNIVYFFLREEIDLFPLHIYLLVPVLTGLSYYIPSSVFVAFGKNKYVLYSTLFSSLSYVLLLIIMWAYGILNSITSFIVLTVMTCFFETVFRLILSAKIFKENSLEKQ